MKTINPVNPMKVGTLVRQMRGPRYNPDSRGLVDDVMPRRGGYRDSRVRVCWLDTGDKRWCWEDDLEEVT